MRYVKNSLRLDILVVTNGLMFYAFVGDAQLWNEKMLNCINADKTIQGPKDL